MFLSDQLISCKQTQGRSDMRTKLMGCLHNLFQVTVTAVTVEYMQRITSNPILSSTELV